MIIESDGQTHVSATIGKITISQKFDSKKYWITNDDGEGMGIDQKFFDEELEKLFNKLF